MATSAEAKQLRMQLRQLDHEIQVEKQTMNEFQLEKERIEQFWATSKKTRDDLKLQLRQKLREKQDLEEKHAFELKIYKQKVKHLLYENQSASGNIQHDLHEISQLVHVQHSNEEQEQKDELFELRRLNREHASAHWEVIKNMRQIQDAHITELREQYTRKGIEAKNYYDQIMNDAIAELDHVLNTDVGRLENKLLAFTKRLLAEHEKRLHNLHFYFREIKYTNLSLIKTLKEDVARLQARDESLSHEIRGKSNINRKLCKPLKLNQEKIAMLRAKLEEYQNDQAQLASVSEVVRGLESKMSNLEWEYEVMLQRVERVKQEKENVKKKLDESIQRVRQSAKFREVFTEKKVVAASIDVERVATSVHEVAVASGIAEIDSDVKDSLEAVLVAKNLAIQHLEKMLVNIRQNHRAAIEAFESKLRAHNIPVEALGFEPKVEN